MGTPAPARAVIGHLLTWLFAAVVAIGLLAVAAPASAAKSSHSKSKSSAAKSFASFESCLSKHGVKLSAHRTGNFANFPHPSFNGTPPSGGGGFPAGGGGFPAGGSGSSAFHNSKYAKAMAACRSKLPKNFTGGGQPFKPSAAQQQALATFDQCLESHGIKISSTTNFQTIRSLMQADPSAAQACQSDLPFGHGPNGSGGTSNSST